MADVKVHNIPIRGVGGRILRDQLAAERLVHVRDSRTRKVVTRWVDFGELSVVVAPSDEAASAS